MNGAPRGWTINPHVAWVGTADRVVVLDLDAPDAAPIILSGSSAEVWHTLRMSGHPEEIVSVVAETFEQPVHEIRDDVLSFLDDLAARAIVRWS